MCSSDLSGDLFGFFEREQETGRPVDGIVVYPRTYALPELGLDSARPFGEMRGVGRVAIGAHAHVLGDREAGIEPEHCRHQLGSTGRVADAGAAGRGLGEVRVNGQIEPAAFPLGPGSLRCWPP